MTNKLSLTVFVIMIFAISTFAQVTSTFTDSRDGKVYKTVTIGTQTWLAENLAYKVDSGCWVYNNDTNNVSTYGYLYNWETSKEVCPFGWHLPSDSAWTKLTKYIGGNIGGKMKETDTTHWIFPNTGATNECYFTALPGGYRDFLGTYIGIGKGGSWWSSTEFVTNIAWSRSIVYDFQGIRNSIDQEVNGFSVRCIKDNIEIEK